MVSIDDYDVIAKFCKFSKNKKEWVFDNREYLKSSSNIYEKRLIKYLTCKKIDFIHQAPFDIDGKIYFADFYLPKFNSIIEVDGDYHRSITQRNKDSNRDCDFMGINIKTIRLLNEETNDNNQLDIRLKCFIENTNNKVKNKSNKHKIIKKASLIESKINELFGKTKIYSVSINGSKIKQYQSIRGFVNSKKIKDGDIVNISDDLYLINNIVFCKNMDNLKLYIDNKAKESLIDIKQ